MEASLEECLPSPVLGFELERRKDRALVEKLPHVLVQQSHEPRRHPSRVLAQSLVIRRLSSIQASVCSASLVRSVSSYKLLGSLVFSHVLEHSEDDADCLTVERNSICRRKVLNELESWIQEEEKVSKFQGPVAAAHLQ